MPNIAPAFAVVNPSYMEPGILLPYSQASGFLSIFAGGDMLPRLSEGDLKVYMKRLDIRTNMPSTGQSAANQLPSVEPVMSLMSTPTYMLRMNANYDHHDVAAMGRWGIALVEAQRLGMRQAHFQYARGMGLYGANPSFGEGILNANGATAVNLPADSNNNTTVVTYDNGQMGSFFLSQIASLLTRTNQLGLPHTLVILGPQRILALLAIANVVQLVQFQREGAGSTTTTGMIKNVAEMNDIDIIWVYDDTLIGKGSTSSLDAVLMVLPEVKKPKGSRVNTNEFAGLQPGIEACTLMYCDRAAPTEIMAPLAHGTTDVTTEWRMTSGYGVRPEAITIMSMQYQ